MTIGANDDPEATGHELIAENFDPNAFRGFPITLARVEYPQMGPRAVFYWLQTVSQNLVSGEEYEDVDCLHGPFYSYGHRPEFMDAPANPDQPDMTWTARTFLTAAPGVLATSRLERITGFCWGYRLRDGRPTVIEATPAGDDDWARLRTTYARWFPDLELG